MAYIAQVCGAGKVGTYDACVSTVCLACWVSFLNPSAGAITDHSQSSDTDCCGQ